MPGSVLMFGVAEINILNSLVVAKVKYRWRHHISTLPNFDCEFKSSLFNILLWSNAHFAQGVSNAMTYWCRAALFVVRSIGGVYIVIHVTKNSQTRNCLKRMDRLLIKSSLKLMRFAKVELQRAILKIFSMHWRYCEPTLWLLQFPQNIVKSYPLMTIHAKNPRIVSTKFWL